MGIPNIKICGVTQTEDIQLCEDLDVDFIGLNFVSSSPRYVDLETAKELRASVHSAYVVGVFADEDIDLVRSISQELSLHFIQLHGSESVEYCSQIPISVIKAFRTLPSTEIMQSYLQEVDCILLDGKTNGQQADWHAIAQLPDDIRARTFLAGGLHPGNVVDAVPIADPYAVDVASGIESEPGHKDHELLQDFISSVRSL